MTIVFASRQHKFWKNISEIRIVSDGLQYRSPLEIVIYDHLKSLCHELILLEQEINFLSYICFFDFTGKTWSSTR